MIPAGASDNLEERVGAVSKVAEIRGKNETNSYAIGYLPPLAAASATFGRAEVRQHHHHHQHQNDARPRHCLSIRELQSVAGCVCEMGRPERTR